MKPNRKRMIPALLSVLLAAATVFIGVPAAQAADDDFSAAYAFYPGGLGDLGGNVRLILHVTNTGSTSITRVDAVINLKDGCSESWSGTIAPGEEKKIVFDEIHFSKDDVNTERLLALSINNDGDSNPDGLQYFRFTIPGADPLWNVSYSILPSRTTLHPGDELRVIFTVKNINTADGMVLEHVNVSPIINMSGEAEDHTVPSEDLGSIDPNQTATYSFSYTLTDADITERLLVWCNVKCALAGANYAEDHYSSPYTVTEAPRATPSPSPSPTPEPIATVTETATPVPSAESTQVVSAALTTPTPQLQSSPSPPAAAAAEMQASGDTLTTVLLIVIAALLLIVVGLCVVLLLRRRRKNKRDG